MARKTAKPPGWHRFQRDLWWVAIALVLGILAALLFPPPTHF